MAKTRKEGGGGLWGVTTGFDRRPSGVTPAAAAAAAAAPVIGLSGGRAAAAAAAMSHLPAQKEE